MRVSHNVSHVCDVAPSPTRARCHVGKRRAAEPEPPEGRRSTYELLWDVVPEFSYQVRLEYNQVVVVKRSVDPLLYRWYIGSMKTKTSVSLSDDLLKLIDGVVDGENRRPAFIEEAVKAYLEVLKRHKRDRKDLQTINRLSERLNREAQDVLSFQKDIQG